MLFSRFRNLSLKLQVTIIRIFFAARTKYWQDTAKNEQKSAGGGIWSLCIVAMSPTQTPPFLQP